MYSSPINSTIGQVLGLKQVTICITVICILHPRYIKVY